MGRRVESLSTRCVAGPTPEEKAVEALAPMVAETGFGRWFLGTATWRKYVLEAAFVTLADLIDDDATEIDRILDLGCGYGMAFPMLARRFSPEAIWGIDADGELIHEAAAVPAGACRCAVQLCRGRAEALPFADESFDLIFCHQTMHHVACQHRAASEVFRVLRRGGVLALSESCRAFVTSPKVRMLFRHPDQAQRTAEGYLDLLRSAGFVVPREKVVMPDPWWGRPAFGAYDALRRRMGLEARHRDATQICAVGNRPK